MVSRVLAEDFELRLKRDRARVIPRMNGQPVEVMVEVSISEIAEGIGMSRWNVSRILNGRVSPRVAVLEAMARYLSRVKGRPITVKDVLDLIATRPWAQPLHVGDL